MSFPGSASGLLRPIEGGVGLSGLGGFSGVEKGASNSDFAKTLHTALHELEGSEREVAALSQRMSNGESVPVEEVVLKSQELTFLVLAAAEVRNRVIEAYHDLMRMPL